MTAKNIQTAKDIGGYFRKKRIISKKHGRGEQKQRQVQKEPVPAFVVM
jgi:hypothetical protein